MQRKLAQKFIKKATTTIHKNEEKKQQEKQHKESANNQVSVVGAPDGKQHGKRLEKIPGLQQEEDFSIPELDIDSIFDSSFWTSEMEHIAKLIEEEEKIDRKGAYQQGRQSAQVVGSILKPYKDNLQQKTEKFENLKFIHISKINEKGKQNMQTVMTTRKLNPRKTNRLATTATSTSTGPSSRPKPKTTPVVSTIPVIDLTKRKIPVISEHPSVVPAPQLKVPSGLPTDPALFILSNFRERDIPQNSEGGKITTILDSD